MTPVALTSRYAARQHLTAVHVCSHSSAARSPRPPLAAPPCSRERNRIHARKSRARKKLFIEGLRGDAAALAAEHNQLRSLFVAVLGKPPPVKPASAEDMDVSPLSVPGALRPLRLLRRCVDAARLR